MASPDLPNQTFHHHPDGPDEPYFQGVTYPAGSKDIVAPWEPWMAPRSSAESMGGAVWAPWASHPHPASWGSAGLGPKLPKIPPGRQSCWGLASVSVAALHGLAAAYRPSGGWASPQEALQGQWRQGPKPAVDGEGCGVGRGRAFEMKLTE